MILVDPDVWDAQTYAADLKRRSHLLHVDIKAVFIGPLIVVGLLIYRYVGYIDLIGCTKQ
jgi:hypothetical protein